MKFMFLKCIANTKNWWYRYQLLNQNSLLSGKGQENRSIYFIKLYVQRDSVYELNGENIESGGVIFITIYSGIIHTPQFSDFIEILWYYDADAVNRTGVGSIICFTLTGKWTWHYYYVRNLENSINCLNPIKAIIYPVWQVQYFIWH